MHDFALDVRHAATRVSAHDAFPKLFAILIPYDKVYNMSFMKQALISAMRAYKHDDVPIGAVIVRGGKIIARGENMVQKKQNPTLHAEIVAINRACKKLGVKFLDDCDIYVSLEPCAMCATAISLARIQNVFFAASDEKGGGITSNARVYDTDKHLWLPTVRQLPEFADKSAKLLRAFFAERRNKKETIKCQKKNI